ncbi:MAG: class I SAM-dependent methyltransferase [Methylobacteriaceae bacterium]|nr:class I SAM-dependent methyltransferase [Methylobacteriaceae bacterium]
MRSSYRLELALRRALPEGAKVWLRAARLLTQPAPPAAPEVPQALLDGAQLVTNRIEMLRRLPRGGRVAELGTLYGDFAHHILTICAPDRLHIVDIHLSNCRRDVLDHPAVEAEQAMTTDWLPRFPDAHFDWIYVDADHGYEAVKADIAAAAPKVRPGGFLVFNDYARMLRPGLGVFGVHQAVTEFIVAARWPVAFLALQGEALYDIALRRPSAGEEADA